MPTFPSPYTPPAAPLSRHCDVSIEGSNLIIPDGYLFPPICPFTGDVTGLGTPTTRRVSAHDKWIYLLLLAGFIPYIIGAIIGARKATFNCRLSDRVTRRWRYYRIAGQLAFFTSFFVGIAGLFGQSIGLASLGLVMFVGGLCTACGLFDGIKASAVRNGKIWLLGMPRAVREKIVEIELKRIEASDRAARATAAAAAAVNLPAPSPVAHAAPPPLPVS